MDFPFKCRKDLSCNYSAMLFAAGFEHFVKIQDGVTTMDTKAELGRSPLSSQTGLNMGTIGSIDTSRRMLWLTCLQSPVVQVKQPEHQKGQSHRYKKVFSSCCIHGRNCHIRGFRLRGTNMDDERWISATFSDSDVGRLWPGTMQTRVSVTQLPNRFPVLFAWREVPRKTSRKCFQPPSSSIEIFIDLGQGKTLPKTLQLGAISTTQWSQAENSREDLKSK